MFFHYSGSEIASILFDKKAAFRPILRGHVCTMQEVERNNCLIPLAVFSIACCQIKKN